MALSNFKNNASNQSEDDEYKRLLCSVAGCGKRWSVKIDRPMCSFHQWGETEYTRKKQNNEETF